MSSSNEGTCGGKSGEIKCNALQRKPCVRERAECGIWKSLVI